VSNWMGQPSRYNKNNDPKIRLNSCHSSNNSSPVSLTTAVSKLPQSRDQSSRAGFSVAQEVNPSEVEPSDHCLCRSRQLAHPDVSA
jgi:hypothetical protein